MVPYQDVEGLLVVGGVLYDGRGRLRLLGRGWLLLRLLLLLSLLLA